MARNSRRSSSAGAIAMAVCASTFVEEKANVLPYRPPLDQRTSMRLIKLHLPGRSRKSVSGFHLRSRAVSPR